MQHYLLYIGDKTTKKQQEQQQPNKKQKHFRGIYCVYVFKRASIQNNRIANRLKQKRE